MFNFINGTELANIQDSLIRRYKENKKIELWEIKQLEDNLWIKTAEKLAPSNLVIRQYSLIDILRNTSKHKNQIQKLLDILSYKNLESSNGLRIFAESYSYFNYTKNALCLWLIKFPDKDIQNILNKIEDGFLETSYNRNGVLYPAPFGDLRNEPLKIQNKEPSKNSQIGVGIIKRYFIDGEITYYIHARPIGLNSHVPKADSTTKIVDGLPVGFKFYEGYSCKYKDVWQEIADTFDPRRIFSR